MKGKAHFNETLLSVPRLTAKVYLVVRPAYLYAFSIKCYLEMKPGWFELIT